MKKMFHLLLKCSFIIFTIFICILLYAILTPIELPNNQITIYDTNNEIMYTSTSASNLEIEDCPSFIKDAIIQVEDKRFYSHIGFDIFRIGKSLITNIVNKDIIEGGSTITQQYAKNIFLSNRQTIKRKVQELFYALQIEMQYEKDEILEGYMNSIYYGHGIYGFKNATAFYFNKSLEDLTIAEIALLIGIPNGPSYYSPYLSMENAIAKRNQILTVLYNNTLINKQEYETALQEEILLNTIDYQKENEKNYYIDAVLYEIDAMDINEEIEVYTYYDATIQDALSTSISIYNKDELQTSGIIMESYSGNIVALQGGNDYTISSYNRAIYSQRQIASTMKPLLYYCALNQGFTPSSTFSSEPTTFTLEDGSTYAPTNYNDVYPNKEISMIQAIRTSDNIYAMKTHLFLGMETLQNALQSFGIKAEALPSLALGTIHLSIYDLSKMYCVFASEGYEVQPSMIKEIVSNHKTIYKREIHAKQLLDRDTTLILNQLLTSPFDTNEVSNILPTMANYEIEQKTSVKSGTSNWDTWVIGYNPYYVVGVWNGYDDNREMTKVDYSIGKKIWTSCFNMLLEEKPEVWYEPSRNIIKKRVNPETGEESKEGSEYWYLR